VRERGVERVADIIKTAQAILVEEGLANLTIRKVARELGISVGNLAYYFSSKETLLQAIIEDVIQGYDEELARESKLFPDSPEKRLKAFLRYMMADAKRHDVRAFFYQFWGLSTHNAQAAELRREMYEHFQAQTTELLEPLHPGMPAVELGNMACSIIANLEGLHVVYGSSGEFLEAHPGFEELVYKQILNNVGISESQ
jgi:AcrR family transcriptional regulator